MNEEFFTGRRFSNEGLITNTSVEQEHVEQVVAVLYDIYNKKLKLDHNIPELLADKHIRYLRRLLFYVPITCTQMLDCSRPWLCYWLIHSLTLLGYELEEKEKIAVINFINKCQCADGGFGGGPGQLPHLASTYASVNVLCCLGTDKAYNTINRKTLKNYLWSMKCSSGSFYLQSGGETDLRGVYCAAAVASITNLMDDQLFERTSEWISKCQTYEGGFASQPGMEAHGGYTFCGIATLTLLNSVYACNVQKLLRWVLMRQVSFEGGFQGRTNKLVDSCYSFWQAGIIPITQKLQGVDCESIDDWFFNRQCLQRYILMCCQHSNGGFVDQPNNCSKDMEISELKKNISNANFEYTVSRYGFKHAYNQLTRNPDPYHTCYALSGLSVAQYSPNMTANDVVGGCENILMSLDPVHNLEVSRSKKAIKYFLTLPSI